MLYSAVSLCTPENSAVQKLSIIIIMIDHYGKAEPWSCVKVEVAVLGCLSLVSVDVKQH